MVTAWNKDPDKISYLDLVPLQMYMKHHMRAYQVFSDVTPDYAYWYGFAEMYKDLGEIKKLVRIMRATYGKH